MKHTSVLLFILALFCGGQATAGDISAEYKMTGSGMNIVTKFYAKNGDVRTEINTNFGGMEMSVLSLKLAASPGVSIMCNSQMKTCNEVKSKHDTAAAEDFTLTELGTEKIGQYLCKHVRMTSKGNSIEMWLTKDLPYVDFPVDKNEASNQKIKSLMKSKGIEGVLVKMTVQDPKSKAVGLTMDLVSYEEKTLDASLFQIPAGYTKSDVQIDPSNMNSMTPEQRQEMLKKLMEQYGGAPQK